MSEILKEYDEQTQTRAKRAYSFKQISFSIFVIVGVVLLAIYVGDMLFGKRSLDVMLGLREKKERLLEDVETLKRYNAQLQKDYFELKELEPQGYKR